jgi:hypothetical protein
VLRCGDGAAGRLSGGRTVLKDGDMPKNDNSTVAEVNCMRSESYGGML